MSDASKAAIAAIRSCRTAEELQEVDRVLRHHWRLVNKTTALQAMLDKKLDVGMMVCFTHKNVTYAGVIRRIGTKNVKVQVEDTMWSCNPALLEPVYP